jgi:hypothetical protein
VKHCRNLIEEVKYRASAVMVFLWFFSLFFLNIGKGMAYRTFVASALMRCNEGDYLYSLIFD